MALNPFYNIYNQTNEQTLVDQLLIESIGMFGLQIYYIPRTVINFNQLYGEDTLSEYNQAFLTECYLKNIGGFGGDGDFLSVIGLQIRDSVTVSVSRTMFNTEISPLLNSSRPREGDLIYFPFNKKIFVIKFVEHEAIFYQTGKLQTYDLQCDLWEYSNERFNTGISEVDAIQTNYSFDMNEYSITLSDGNFLASDDGFAIVQSSYSLDNFPGTAIADNNMIESNTTPIIDSVWNANNWIGDLS